MKVDLWTKVGLWVVAAMLFLNLVYNIFSSEQAMAVSESETIGRYQISSWAAHSEGVTNHNGYYIIDTVTVKVVGERAETHGKRD